MSVPRWLGPAAGALLAIGTIAGVAVWLQSSTEAVEGPRPIVYGAEACGHCKMQIGDAQFAAQLVTADGEAISFDDPGCLMRLVAEQKPRVRALYFHHGSEERWLDQASVGFERGATSPMGFGLRAVDRNTPGALDYASASRQVLESKPAGAEH